jgi:signal transduction histidine kinase
LGLTVLLNAERRTLGIWLAGGGLLAGGAFFLSHTAILILAPEVYDTGVNLLWHFGLIPVILAPYTWYAVMLWYAGYWEEGQWVVNRRHRMWFWLLTFTAVSIAAMLVVSNPLPSLIQATHLDWNSNPSIMSVPLLFLLYPVYITACIALSMDALLRPGPTHRMMGHLARRRARPWLIAASCVLLLVSLLVGAGTLWLALNVRQSIYNILTVLTITQVDLIISLLIAIAVVLTGQAIASYEIFTGRTLPRKGSLRYWFRALVLATGYSVLIGFILTLDTYPIYGLLLSTCLLVVFFALLSWRSYADREQFISKLRPFVNSQQLYEQLVAQGPRSQKTDLNAPFRALCEDVLGSCRAYLFPLGSMSPLFGPPLAYPGKETPPLAPTAQLTSLFSSPQTLCVPLNPETDRGAEWAVPLWNDMGLCGVLLFGEKLDGGLYSQEEIEIAREVCERLMDIQASTEIARRLMEMQRQQLAESQLIDWRVRRILHDDILPQLHTALLNLSDESTSNSQDTIVLLSRIHHQIADLLRDMPGMTTAKLARSGLIKALEQLIEGELKHAFNQVKLDIDPEIQKSIDKIPPTATEVCFYATREAIRNAARHARHGQYPTSLNLQISLKWKKGLEIIIDDNGIGIGPANSLDINEAGSGSGLALHSTMLAVIGGSLSVENPPDASTRVHIRLPVVEES